MADLTPQQLEKDVKRINERINEVVKLLGSNSEAYHKYVAKLKSLLPSQYVRVDKDGLFKIARKKELYQQAGDEKIQRAFQQILKTPTAGEIKRHAKTVIKEERKKALQLDPSNFAAPPDAFGVGAGAVVIEPQHPDVRITKKEIEDFAKMLDKISGFVADNSDMFYVAYQDPKLNDMIHKKGKRTYSELNELIDAYQDHRYSESASIFDDIDY